MNTIPKRENALFGRQLRKLMKDRGWNCTDIGNMAGVSPKSVSHWCCGRCLPEAATFKRLCLAVGRDASYFKAHGYVYRNATEINQPALPLAMPQPQAEQPKTKSSTDHVFVTLQNVTLANVPLELVSAIAPYVKKEAA